jgi:hypothetical protein
VSRWPSIIEWRDIIYGQNNAEYYQHGGGLLD